MVGADALAVGARVRVFVGGRVFVDEVHSGRGYQSHFGSRLHFGIGANDQIDKIEVRWPDGELEKFDKYQANQHLRLEQDSTNNK